MILQAAIPAAQQPRNSTERRISWAQGELALVCKQPEMALTIADCLLSFVPGGVKSQPIPWLLKLKGEALAALSRREEALQELEKARLGAIARQEQPLLWQIHRALGRQYRQSKQEEQAESNFRAAREIIATLASTLDDTILREQFSQAALATLPRAKSVPASRAIKSAFGGLTEREREIVAFIAQGRSNREIAEELIVTKRTVETHINNILYKLDFTSRTQIVVWAIEKGLTKR
jgi:DNA-binding CsgD family transcriptional regulator